MALRIPRHLEVYRRAHPITGDIGGPTCFLLVIPARGLRIIGSSDRGWDHVSVSRVNCCPTWDEMEWVKRELWEAGDTVMQLHVPPSEHVNYHPYCLHLWRPHYVEIPRPPSNMVA